MQRKWNWHEELLPSGELETDSVNNKVYKGSDILIR